MADFVLSTTNKTSVRTLTVPIADAETFNGIIENVLTNNPWGCTPWEGAGESHDGVEKAAEAYTAKIVYEDDFGDVIGNASARTPTLAGFNAAKTELLANTAMETAVGGHAVDDPERETYTCRLRCHDPGGEVYFVAFTRTSVRISSYEDDAICDAIETWADGVAALA